ncbi:hypothetical protein AB0A63_00305 [Lentzea sp. NPDC042327]|uniref:DISARM anti-phage system protein DrmE domain-containing protein n=1 Tax=Lentzea sp. NPDC042327 TaxID=3154801 RepID=UPI00340C2A79
MTKQGLSGLSHVVRRGKLRHKMDAGVRRFATTGFDDELLAAVDGAAAAGVPLALVVPLPAADIPVVLGAAALAAEVVRARRLDVAATVVSKRLSQRAGYDRLYIDGQRLAELIPRARLTANGSLEVFGKAQHDTGGRMVLTSELARAANSTGGLVIDGTGGDPGDLRPVLGGHRTLVYVTDNPFDLALDTVRAAGGVVWAFDPAALSRLSTVSDPHARDGGQALAAPGALLAAAGSAHRVVWTPDGDSSLDDALAATWGALGRLAATETRTADYEAAHALRWAWGTLATYSQLATTPDCYDRHLTRGPYATALADAPVHARAVAGNRSGAARDAWASLAEKFAALHGEAGAATKLPLLQSWLDGICDDGRTGLLVTRNRTAAAAVTSALQDSPKTRHGWLDHVRVVSARDVLYGRVQELPVDTVLLTGPLPRAYASLAVAPPATELLTTAAGQWESTRVACQTTATVRALCALREETATIASPRLGVEASAGLGGVGEGAAGEVTVWKNGTVLAPGDLPAQDGSPWAPLQLDLLAVLTGGSRGRDDAPDIAPPARSDGSSESSAAVHALTVTFTDSRYLLVDPNDLIYRRRGEGSSRAAAKSLVVGDVVALVDSAARRDLFGTVVDALSELPKYQLLATLVGFWHQRVALARHHGLTMRGILRSMQVGPDPTRITTEAAVGHWFSGYSEGPNDPADVRRFAVAVGDRELIARADPVGAALRTSRVVNRRIGKWLSAQITGARLCGDDDVVDAELGVHVADLLEAVSLHEVAEVSGQLVVVPASAVGVLHAPGGPVGTPTAGPALAVTAAPALAPAVTPPDRVGAG